MNPRFDHRVLRLRLPEYAAPFEKVRPEILAGFEEIFPFKASSDKGLGILLLFAAIYRSGGEAAAARLISGLYRRFKNDIFRLNRIAFEAVRDEIEALKVVRDPEERARIPGILRSVCDFFYRVGPLGPWLAAAPDWETRVMELCGEIYWMGRQSLMRNKARYFLWLVSVRSGFLEAHPEALPLARNFSWPVGEGHLRFYADFLKSSRGPAALDAEKRLEVFRDMARDLFPDSPWKLFAPLDAYLRRGGALEYHCRSLQGGCRSCPLAAGCPASAHFFSIEPVPSPR